MLGVSGHSGNVRHQNKSATPRQRHVVVPRPRRDHRAVLRLSQSRTAFDSAQRPRLDPPSSILRVLLVLPDARRVHYRSDFLDHLRDGGGARRALRAHPDSRDRHRAVGAGGRIFSRRRLFLRRARAWQPPRGRDGCRLSHLHQPGVEHGARRLRSGQNHPRGFARTRSTRSAATDGSSSSACCCRPACRSWSTTRSCRGWPAGTSSSRARSSRSARPAIVCPGSAVSCGRPPKRGARSIWQRACSLCSRSSSRWT